MNFSLNIVPLSVQLNDSGSIFIMKPQSVSKQTSSVSQFKKYPCCVNKKEARMVCLNQGCSQYAFFCLQCEDQSCEAIHRHQNNAEKFVAISFKEFIRRVLKERKPIQELQQAILTYRQTLERLRTDINQFVEKELISLNEVSNKAQEVPEELYPTIKKLKEQTYEGLFGKQMDYLWKNCGDSQQTVKIQQQTSEFIRIKEEELKAISQHFENLNKMEIDKIEESFRTNSQNNTIEGKRGSPSGASNNPVNGIAKRT